jgi:hypothetical protein
MSRELNQPERREFRFGGGAVFRRGVPFQRLSDLRDGQSRRRRRVADVCCRLQLRSDSLGVPYELSRERSDSGQLDPAGPLKWSAREIPP